MKKKYLKNSMLSLLQELTQHQIILKWWFIKLLAIPRSNKKLESKYKSTWVVMTTVSRIWRILNTFNSSRKKQPEFMVLALIYFLDQLWPTTISMDYLLKKELSLIFLAIATTFQKNILKTLVNSDLKDGKLNVITYLHLYWVDSVVGLERVLGNI